MTNEEAIKHLKWFSEYNEDEYCGGDRIQKGADWYYYINKEDFEAFDMAIKALSIEPCCNCIEFKRYAKEMGFEIEQKPCEDAISLKEVIEWLKTKDIIKLSSQEETARRELKALSSVKPQEPCEDCISRQGAIDALDYNIRITSDEGLEEYKTVLKEMLVKIYDTQKAQIEALPSIQPKPKTDVLDKIRSEIEHLTYYWCEVNPRTVIDDVLQIIDKYTAEKE